MQCFDTLPAWITHRSAFDPACRIGFVPTMGNLHAGHASLIKQSLQDTDYTLVSVFVNPMQFNEAADYHHYPRTLERDKALLQQLGVHACLIPTPEAIYPEGQRFQIQETDFSTQLEGEHRPGHFTGVLTVVMKLLQLVKPHIAYFGEKDYQQYTLLRDMVKDFFMGIRIQACPTVRESSGLACSSRNTRLNPEQRQLADQFATLFHQPRRCEEIIAALTALTIRVDYLTEYQGRRWAAVWIDNVRLIDNYSLLSPIDITHSACI